jgi:hypothetical protein
MRTATPTRPDLLSQLREQLAIASAYAADARLLPFTRRHWARRALLLTWELSALKNDQPLRESGNLGDPTPTPEI